MLREVSIEIIRKCPNCCLHCSSLSNKQCEEIIPFDKFKEVILDAAKLGAKTISLSGGEPFLHDRIIDMVKFVRACQLDCYIYTSGITLDHFNNPVSLPVQTLEQISGYATKLIFNIEAATASTYDNIMGTQNCFEKMQVSALRAADAGLCTEAHFVPMAINIDEIDSVVLLCKKLRISRLSFLRLVLHGRAYQNSNLLALSAAKYLELKNHLKEIQSQADLAIRIGVPLSTDTSCHNCEAATGKLNIRYDGTVFPCEVFKNYSLETSLGCLKPDSIYCRSLFDIYNHSDYLNRVRVLVSERKDAYKCETCIGQHLIRIEEDAK